MKYKVIGHTERRPGGPRQFDFYIQGPEPWTMEDIAPYFAQAAQQRYCSFSFDPPQTVRLRKPEYAIELSCLPTLSDTINILRFHAPIGVERADHIAYSVETNLVDQTT